MFDDLLSTICEFETEMFYQEADSIQYDNFLDNDILQNAAEGDEQYEGRGGEVTTDFIFEDEGQGSIEYD